LHHFRPDIFENRAAEYGIDDIDVLVELVLYEPLIETTEHLTVSVDVARELHTAKVAAAKSRVVKQLARGQVRSDADGKIADKALLTQAGVDQKYIDAIDLDPIEVIKSYMVFDPEVLAEKRVYIAQLREATQRNVVPDRRLAARTDRAPRIGKSTNRSDRESRKPVQEPTMTTVHLNGNKRVK
jgi:hypothetical protein